MQLCGGTDLYTNAISDVYQDNFDEGIFTGKGIYNLKVFSEVVTNQIPENTVLSHDLLEGSYLRCGLVSDIMLLDGFPSKYNSYMTRLKRWIRGDWQIIRWASSKIKIKNGTYIINPLNSLSKFKILDNLRRSLVPISILILLILGFIRTTTPDGELILIGIASAAIPAILAIIDKVVYRKELENGFVIASKNFLWKVGGVTGILYQTLLEIAFLPYKAYISLIAILKTLYRMFVSKQNLLEWMTAEEAEKQAATTKRAYYLQMLVNVISGIIILAFSIGGNLIQRVQGVVIGLLWIIGPAIACNISKPFYKLPAIRKIR